MSWREQGNLHTQVREHGQKQWQGYGQQRQQQQQQQQQHQNPYSSQPRQPYSHAQEDESGTERNEDATFVGVIENLKNTYGFIVCSERSSTIFFHYSACSEAPRNLAVGQHVEFRFGADSRSGKEVAQDVNVLSADSPRAKDVTLEGTVMKITETDPNGEQHGQIQYHSGKWFNFSVPEDIAPGEDAPGKGDRVSFHVVADEATQAAKATDIHVLHRCDSSTSTGVVKLVREGFGFIDRADADDNIFFHFSELPRNTSVQVGDCVAFKISSRHNKPIAVDINFLAPGSVVLEETGTAVIQGRIKSLPMRSRDWQLSQPGIIEATTDESNSDNTSPPKKFPYHDNDVQSGSKQPASQFRIGDTVEFRVCRDLRNGKERASAIEFVRENEALSTSRETGIITTVKDSYGFIKCADREGKLFFRFRSMLDQSIDPAAGMEVEFNVENQSADHNTEQSMDSTHRMNAVRVKVLPRGSITFETKSSQLFQGVVITQAPQSSSSHHHAAAATSSPYKNRSRQIESDERNASTAAGQEDNLPPGTGSIEYEGADGTTKLLPFRQNDVRDIRVVLQPGDQVQFCILTDKRARLQYATDIELLSRQHSSVASSQLHGTQCGFISDIKEGYGFIETEAGDAELFFHFSEFQGKPSDIHVLDPVSYDVQTLRGRPSAKHVRKLDPEELESVEILDEATLKGQVVAPLNGTDGYGGKISYTEAGQPVQIRFSVTSLNDPQYALKPGDPVSFQIATNINDDSRRAVHVKFLGQKTDNSVYTAKVEWIKGEYGFLSFKTDGKDELFFHTSYVKNNEALAAGDEVEFTLFYNNRAHKYSATNIKLISRAPAPAPVTPSRPIIRRESSSVLRHPKGPDGTRGFRTPRTSVSSIDVAALDPAVTDIGASMSSSAFDPAIMELNEDD